MGHYTWRCIWGYRQACYAALKRAEAKHGRPVYLIEISQEWNSVIPKIAGIIIQLGLQDLFKADEVMADLEHNLYTTDPTK